MKKFLVLATTIISLGLVPAFAQFGGRGSGQGPDFSGGMDKLFGANQTFTAAMEIQINGENGDITMPGKMSFDNRKSRFEMNVTEIKGSQLPASAVQQMKAIGMDRVISIARPDLKVIYLIYPGLNSYARITPQNAEINANPENFKLVSTKLGNETVDGHDCVKNQVTVTDKDGNAETSTVWNASDLKNFPIKIVTGDTNRPATISFKNISFVKPDASLFEAPANFTKYDNLQTLMQTEMAKRMGGGAGTPPPQ